MKRVLTVFGVLFGVLAALVLAALVYYFGVTASAVLEPEKLSLHTQSVRILDGEGAVVECAARPADVPFGEFPQYLPNAFVAVEDKRFYSHHGFDVRRIAKAMVKNIASFSFREGASTISQQLIKNTHLTSEKTVNRKLREMKLTRALERRYSKEEILELYLNSIYFGHSAFGVASAAQFYFGKEVADLTPAESAMLAALVRSPNRYSPFKDAEKCLSRRNYVLSLMRDQGYLGEREYEAALQEPLPVSPTQTKQNAYLDLVYDELAALFPDVRADELSSLTVSTAYRASVQQELERIQAESDAAALVRNNATNAIEAFYSTAGVLKRLPASVIKPLLVYAPALEENLISPATPLLDARTDFGGYCPDDSGGASGKYMSARTALARSVNIPAVRLLNSLGVDRAVRYLDAMDLHIPEDDRSLALALGGMREGFTLAALADGYSTFASGGCFSPSGAILEVKDAAGRLLYARKAEPKRVFSEDVAYLVTDMLQTAAKEGTARKLRSLPFPVAAKTGTGEASGKNLDAYTLAYTREHVVAVWMGNRDNSPVNATGGGLPANEALRILTSLYAAQPPEPFLQCASVERLAYDRLEYETNHRILLSDPAAPPYSDPSELFRACSKPQAVSTRFSRPTIEKPSICVQNGSVILSLCQAEYYEYVIKRENRGVVTTIYSGEFRESICDNSVRSGETYEYTVTPYFEGHEGESVVLPRVRIQSSSLPDNWWDDQNSSVSTVPSASSTSASTLSLLSSSSM